MKAIGVLVATASLLSTAIAPAEAARSRSCMGKRATIVGTSGADTLTGTRKADVIVGLGGDDTIVGKGGDDTLCGNGGIDEIYGGPARDRVNGGGGDDVLVAGSKSDLYASGGDTFKGGGGSDIVIGGPVTDVMSGGAGIDALLGLAGADDYYGDGGTDIAAFLAAPSGVTVDLGFGTASGEGADDLYGIEAVMGSDQADVIRGDAGPNFFWGMAGNDVLDGRGERDFAFFTFADGGVSANLMTGSASGEGADSLQAIENLIGGKGNDVLTGDTARNVLQGDGGYDEIEGNGDADVCYGEEVYECPPELWTTETESASASGTTDDPASSQPRADAPTTIPEGARPVRRNTTNGGGYGYVRCFVGESGAQAYMPTYYYGQGRLAARARYPGGYVWSNWSYYPYMWFGQDEYGTLRWWYWNGAQWIPYNYWSLFVASPPGTVVDMWWQAGANGSWYQLGECLVEHSVATGGIIGLPVYMVYDP